VKNKFVLRQSHVSISVPLNPNFCWKIILCIVKWSKYTLSPYASSTTHYLFILLPCTERPQLLNHDHPCCSYPWKNGLPVSYFEWHRLCFLSGIHSREGYTHHTNSRILTSNSPTNPNLRDHFVKDDHQTTSHVCMPLVLACLCRIMKYHPFPLVSGGGRAGTRQCRFCNSVEIEPLVLLSFDRQNDISKPEYTKHSQFFYERPSSNLTKRFWVCTESLAVCRKKS